MNKPVVFLKSHIDAFTRKDGVVVQAHDTKVTAKAAPFAAKPFKHGGHQVTNGGKHHIILDDERVASQHADVMNHVASSGKSDHMAAAVGKAADEHMGIEGLHKEDAADSDHFNDTGKVGVKHALTAAYNAGAGGDHAKLRAHRDAIVNESAKHFGDWDTLKPANHDSEDFKENSRSGVRHMLQHAYAHGAKMAHDIEGKPAAAPAAPAGLHHKDLREGDEIEGPDGERHEYSHTQQGLGRKVVHTAAGHTIPTAKDGSLEGFKKTGTNFADPAPAAKPKAAPVKRASPKPKAKPGLDPHPNVIGKAEKGDKRSMHFDGKQYHATGKTGHSFHDNTAVAEYEHPESGHRVWRDGQDRVHADSTEEAKKARGG